MSSDFMPTALDSLTSGISAYTAKTSGTPTAEELKRMGINLVDSDNNMGLQFDDFLQLMVQQLQNQTIDNTADTSDMLNQLVQMSTVQMLTSVKDSMEALVSASALNYAASLVGKTVTVGQYDEDGNIQKIVGTVTGTGTYQGTSVIFVDGKMYTLKDIMAVGTLPNLPKQPSEGTEGGGEAAGKSAQQSVG